MNWMRAKPMLVDLGERARRERLREPGVVLEQDVAVREETHEDELERLPLADDCPLDLVEHTLGDLLHLSKRDVAI